MPCISEHDGRMEQEDTRSVIKNICYLVEHKLPGDKNWASGNDMDDYRVHEYWSLKAATALLADFRRRYKFAEHRVVELTTIEKVLDL